MKSVPCSTCPWRTDATAADIPNYDPEAARKLLATTCGNDDEIRPVMACHGTTGNDTSPCIGYLASDDGYANITVRLMAVRRDIDLSAVYDACGPLHLHPTYADVLTKLERDR